MTLFRTGRSHLECRSKLPRLPSRIDSHSWNFSSTIECTNKREFIYSCINTTDRPNVRRFGLDKNFLATPCISCSSFSSNFEAVYLIQKILHDYESNVALQWKVHARQRDWQNYREKIIGFGIILRTQRESNFPIRLSLCARTTDI